MKRTGKTLNGILSAVGILLCVVFGLMLLFNLTIIIKGLINSDVPPSVFGVTPLVVKSGSMSSDVQHTVHSSELVDITQAEISALKPGDKVYTKAGDLKIENVIVSVNAAGSEDPFYLVERPVKDHIEVGDLIFSKAVEPSELKVGDVISFMENSSVVTHRIIRVVNEGGKLSFVTKGDANNSEDTGDPVPADKVVGRYASRIPALGDFIYFLQKPLGMVIFIGVPVLAFIIYDMIRRARSSKGRDKKTEALEEELERLRKMAKELEERKAAEDGR
ncbi:MAG: signal peptidase I [Clostridia bacterium]|nr:signal peptidase I [Clostridia bacterium]